MNYININETGLKYIDINSFAESLVPIDWIIYKEGNDTDLYAFTAPLLNGTYFQTLGIDLDQLTLSKDVFYILEGRMSGNVVYRGKILATDGDMTPSTPISVHKGNYTENSNDETYIILE